MARYDDLNTQTISVVGVCGAVGTFVTIIALQVLYYHYESQEMDRKVVAVANSGSESILSEQRSRLNEYGWIDRDRQIVAVPIDEAMNLVLDHEQKAIAQGTTGEIR